MVMVSKHGLMVQDMKETMNKEKNMDMEILIGLTEANMMENFKIIISREKE
jgi:hypothetical protein